MTALTSRLLPLLRAASSRATSFHTHATANPSTKIPYPGFVPLSLFQQGFLAVGSAVLSIVHPYRQDMIAALGETTSGPFLGSLRDQLLSTSEGRAILRERPIVSSAALGGMDALRKLPGNTFGRECVKFWDEERVSPDTRSPVAFVACPELAYIILRHRQTHDFAHALTALPTSVPGELALKYFEFAQAGLPVSLLASVFGPLRLSTQERRQLREVYVPWALRSGARARLIMSVPLEKKMEMDLTELRKYLRLEPAPQV